MTREDALKKISVAPYTEEIEDDFEYVVNKLEISVELKNLMNGENKSFRDYNSNYLLINFFTKLVRLAGIEKGLLNDRNYRLWSR